MLVVCAVRACAGHAQSPQTVLPTKFVTRSSANRACCFNIFALSVCRVCSEERGLENRIRKNIKSLDLRLQVSFVLHLNYFWKSRISPALDWAHNTHHSHFTVGVCRHKHQDEHECHAPQAHFGSDFFPPALSVSMLCRAVYACGKKYMFCNRDFVHRTILNTAFTW